MTKPNELNTKDTSNEDAVSLTRTESFPGVQGRSDDLGASQDQLNLYDYMRVGSQQYLPGDQSSSIGKFSTDSLAPAPNSQEPFSASARKGSFHNHSGKEVDKSYIRGSRICLAISVVSALLVVALEGFMYGVINVHKEQFNSTARYMEMSIFLALFIFAGIYQVVVTIIAQHTKNMLLFSLLCLFYATMVIYTGIQYQELSNNLDIVKSRAWRNAAKGTNIAAIAVLGVTFVAQSVLIYFVLNRSVRWFKFKKIGASIAMKRMYTVFQIHRSLLVFDLFFFLGFTVQFIVIMVSDKTSKEFILTCCMLPLTIVVLFLADFAATRELLWLSLFTLCCLVAGAVYVLFKTVRLFTKYTSAYDIALKPGSYFPGRTSLVTFAVITLIFIFVTIAFESWSIANYNHGLLPSVNTYYSRLPLSSSKAKENEKRDDESMLID